MAQTFGGGPVCKKVASFQKIIISQGPWSEYHTLRIKIINYVIITFANNRNELKQKEFTKSAHDSDNSFSIHTLLYTPYF